MSEGFIGEIRMFAGNFAPRSWALCDGQLLAINQNQSLFTLLGTTYGGDGRTTFALPDMRGRLPVHMGQGPGLANRNIGSKFGAETASVSVAEMPAHRHDLLVSTAGGTQNVPDDSFLASSPNVRVYRPQATNVALGIDAIEASTSSPGQQPHSNIMPFQCVNFIIALSGVFPSRN